MMRRVIPEDELYAWHRAALAGERPPIHEGDPRCGWFKRRLVKRGPWVPARIWLEQPVDEAGALIADTMLRCEVDGERRDPEAEWSFLAGQPIPESEYDWMIADRAWLRIHEPASPLLATHTATPISEGANLW